MPGAAFVMAARNTARQNERADEYLQMQRESMRRGEARESAALARQKELDQYKRKVDAFAAMPMLQRMAARSVGMANTNPYGVQFSERFEAPDQGQADAEVSKFLDTPPEQPTAPLPHQLEPGEEGPVYQPTAEELMDHSAGAANLDPIAQAAVASFRAPTKRISATFQGQQYDLPEEPTTSGFGPKYDAIYQRFLQEPGVTPEEALNAVAKMAHEDSVEAGRNQRLVDQEAGRDRRFEGYHMDVDQQFDALQRRLDQSDKNSRRAAAAGGGVVRVPALQAFVEASNKLNPGEPITPEVAKLGVDAGFKPNQIATEVDRYRNSDAKSLKGGGGGVLSLKEIAPLNTSIDNIDKLIGQIQKNPQAWEEYRANAENWKRKEGLRKNWFGQTLQGVGIMDVSPEQGLKTTEGKTLFQRQETLDTDIAKSFGGVITEGDRDSARAKQANLALNAQEKVQGLMELRDSLIAKRNVFMQSRAPGSPAPGSSTAVRTLRMPDGTIARFDASGRRVE